MNRDRIFLIGFSGSGKSEVGKKLASELKVPFFDTDRMVEKKARRTITAIFAEDGERAFRRMEREVTDELVARKRTGMVVALGGGAFESGHIRRAVQKCGKVVYLSCARRELYRRLRQTADRPLLHAPSRGDRTSSITSYKRLNALLDRRIANYRKADFSVSTTRKTVAQVVAVVSERLGR